MDRSEPNYEKFIGMIIIISYEKKINKNINKNFLNFK